MKRRTVTVSFLIVVTLLVAACTPQAAPAPAPQIPAPAPAPLPAAAPAPAPAPAKPAWEAEWEKVLQAAKKEGRVIIHTDAGGAVRLAIMKIAKLQGIEAEVVVVRSAEAMSKAVLEHRVGVYQKDIHLGGPGAVIPIAKPAGILERIDSALILPHVTDPEVIKKVWYKGELPWVDQDHTILAIALQPGTAITINTNLVKPDEVKSWRDLLDPKWSGKVAFNDPTVPGYGPMAVQTMVNLMGEDYVKELAKAKPIIIRDQRQLVDWLAHGKIAIAIGAPVEILVEFIGAGAPLKPLLPQEGTWLGPGNAGGMDWFKNAPHPNASKVFINWITSKEAQEIFAPAGGFHSTRVDVSTAHLLPGLARTEGAKYFPAYLEESYLKRPITDKLAKDLFGQLVK